MQTSSKTFSRACRETTVSPTFCVLTARCAAEHGRPKVPIRKLSPSGSIKTVIHAPGFYDFALQNLFHARPARETPYFRKIEFIDRLTVLYLDFVLCAIQRSREIFPAPAKYYVFFLHSAFQILFALLIAFFAEQSEHILLVCLDAWLIEGIYAEQIAGSKRGSRSAIHPRGRSRTRYSACRRQRARAACPDMPWS